MERWMWLALGGAAAAGVGYYFYDRSRAQAATDAALAAAAASAGGYTGGVRDTPPAGALSPAAGHVGALIAAGLSPTADTPTTQLVAITTVSRSIPLPT